MMTVMDLQMKVLSRNVEVIPVNVIMVPKNALPGNGEAVKTKLPEQKKFAIIKIMTVMDLLMMILKSNVVLILVNVNQVIKDVLMEDGMMSVLVN